MRHRDFCSRRPRGFFWWSALLGVVLLCCVFEPKLACAGEPLRVYILAGQSNMQGHARVETFGYIGEDEATAPLLAKMQQADGTPVVCDRVWISYLTGRGDSPQEVAGPLTAGYGARRNALESDGKIGPEFTFGLTVQEQVEGRVLIIKTAWGGKSLFHDFRPPSAGIYPRTTDDVERSRFPESDSGKYYRLMIEHIKNVLSDISRVCPDYHPENGFELSGFVWFQGWNDMVNRGVYPEVPANSERPRFAKYSELLADFIRDVRRDLEAPELPFVIGIMGVDGDSPNRHGAQFRKAMAAPARIDEFKGNVFAVPTAPYWDEALAQVDAKYGQVRQMAYYLRKEHKDHANRDGSMDAAAQKEYLRQFEAELISPEEVALRKRGASNAGYHYLGCAKTFAGIGEAFALPLLAAEKSARAEEAGVSVP